MCNALPGHGAAPGVVASSAALYSAALRWTTVETRIGAAGRRLAPGRARAIGPLGCQCLPVLVTLAEFVPLGFELVNFGAKRLALGPQQVGRPLGRLAPRIECRALGDQGVALACQGVALGDQGVALGDHGVALGDQGVALGDQGVALGNQGVALGDQGVALGDQGVAPGDQGVALACQGVALGDQGVALGDQGVALACQDVALGNQGVALACQGIALLGDDVPLACVAPDCALCRVGLGARGSACVSHFSCLSTSFKICPNMRLYAKTLSGKTVTLNVPETATVDDVKFAIHASEGIPPEQQRLIFAGRQLLCGWTVRDSRIQEESTLHICRTLGSGPPSGEAMLALDLLVVSPSPRFSRDDVDPHTAVGTPDDPLGAPSPLDPGQPVTIRLNRRELMRGEYFWGQFARDSCQPLVFTVLDETTGMPVMTETCNWFDPMGVGDVVKEFLPPGGWTPSTPYRCELACTSRQSGLAWRFKTAAIDVPDPVCPVCFDAGRTSAFVPCGHVVCGGCAERSTLCPVCRAAFQFIQRIYL